MKRNILLILSSLTFCLTSQAQDAAIGLLDSIQIRPFSHMQVGVSVGSTGLGVEIVAPVTNNVRVRAGFNILPTITLTKSYPMTSVGSLGGETTEEEQDRRINHLCDMLGNMVNAKVDPYVDMDHSISLCNARFLVDWYPFKKKNWHFTAGAYVGSKSIGMAINTTSEANTMVAINMYNNMYDQIQELGEGEYPYFEFGKVSFELDPHSGEYLKNAFDVYGRVAVKLGEFHDGTPHYVTPDENAVMQADAEIWAVKPYLGFGLSKSVGYDKRWTLGFDAGAMFWGKPHVYTSDGVDLVNDVTNIGGSVGNYINLLKKLPFYPNLEVRMAYTIF